MDLHVSMLLLSFVYYFFPSHRPIPFQLFFGNTAPYRQADISYYLSSFVDVPPNAPSSTKHTTLQGRRDWRRNEKGELRCVWDMAPGYAAWAHKEESRRWNSSQLVLLWIEAKIGSIIRYSKEQLSSKPLCAFGKRQSLDSTRPSLGNQSDSHVSIGVDGGDIRFFRSIAQVVQHLGQLRKTQISLKVQNHHCLHLTHKIDHSLCITGDEGRWVQFPPCLLPYFGHVLLRMQAIPHDYRPQMLFSLKPLLESNHLLSHCLVLPRHFLHPGVSSLEIQLHLSQQALIIEHDGLSQSLPLSINGRAQLGMQLVAAINALSDSRIGLVKDGQLLCDTAVDGVCLIVDGNQIDGGCFGGVFLAMDGQTVSAKGKQTLFCPAKMGDDIVIVEGAGCGWAFEHHTLHD